VRVVVDVVSVMAAYFDLLCVCIHKHIGTGYVILDKRWIWVPDYGFM